MDARDLLPYRTPLIGGLIALSVGLTAGLVLRTGSQEAPPVDSYALGGGLYAEAEPIVWPGGKVPDYVVGTDFLDAGRTDPPVVVAAAYDVPEYVAPLAPPEAELPAQPARPVEPSEPRWASTSGDILDVRLPEDPPAAPEPPRAPEALVAPSAPVPVVAVSD